jgi:hypothetical protein
LGRALHTLWYASAMVLGGVRGVFSRAVVLFVTFRHLLGHVSVGPGSCHEGPRKVSPVLSRILWVEGEGGRTWVWPGAKGSQESILG